jgi:hypothetical protein
LVAKDSNHPGIAIGYHQISLNAYNHQLTPDNINASTYSTSGNSSITLTVTSITSTQISGTWLNTGGGDGTGTFVMTKQ